ncbi:hypothetical protein [Martelella sp. AD-3]|uniref:hypothetical protein n=1 Tax=Martelella sp. AD-3 TaxID=686597 RepID=UPI000465359F|nr:hypothetical protein [Martelella sp. AD-3]AMM86379.1 hypothetical protein AZF01_20250 [Martelella sp. AD-3]
MHRIGIAAGLFLAATGTLADDLKPGWSVQFHQDIFDRTIVPLAIASEEGDDFDKASLGAVCSQEGDVIIFFQPRRFMFFETSAKLALRSGDTVAEYDFVAEKIPAFGSLLAVDSDRSQKIMTLFADADGADIAFRTEDKNGLISSIGAGKTFEIVKTDCPGPAG